MIRCNFLQLKKVKMALNLELCKTLRVSHEDKNVFTNDWGVF